MENLDLQVPRGHRRALRNRILLMFGAAQMAVMLLTVGFTLNAFRQAYMRSLAERGMALASGIVEEATTQIARGDDSLSGLSRFGLMLSRMQGSSSEITDCYIVDNEGTILAHPDQNRVGRTIENPGLLNWLHNARRGTSLFKDDDRYIVATPIRASSDQTVAYVAIAYTAEAVKDTLWEIRYKAAVVALLGFALIVIAFALIFNRSIEEPLRQLMQAFAAIQQGRLREPIPEFRDVEFQTTSHALTRMVDRLRQITSRAVALSSKLSESGRAVEVDFGNLRGHSQRQHDQLHAARSSMDLLDKEIKTINKRVEELFLLAQDTSSSVLEIGSSVEEVDESMNHLNSLIESMEQQIRETTGDLTGVAAIARTLAVESDELASAITEVIASIQAVEQNANVSRDLSQRVAARAADGMGAVKKSREEMSRIKSVVVEVNNATRDLGRRSVQIEEILKVINQVAEKTNLLALNTAIIATQAGEHGRSFGVVADEIRELARQVANSTRDIEDLITSVQQTTQNVLDKMSESLNQVERGETQTTEAVRILAEILSSAKESEDMGKQIAHATSEQSSVSKKIGDTTVRIQEFVHKVAASMESQADSSQRLTHASEKIRDLSNMVKRALQEENTGVKRISQSVEQMNEYIGQISGSTTLQANSGAQIHRMVEENVALLEENVAILTSIRDKFTNLLSESGSLNDALGVFDVREEDAAAPGLTSH